MKRYLLLSLLPLIAYVAKADEPFNGLITRLDGTGIKATVAVKDSDKHTRSDGKGRFGLTDIKGDDILYIIVKRDTTTVALEGRRSIHIVLAEEGEVVKSEESEELMNYGFGYVKRRESLDYSSGISGDRLRATGCSDLQRAIMMCYPGLIFSIFAPRHAPLSSAMDEDSIPASNAIKISFLFYKFSVINRGYAKATLILAVKGRIVLESALGGGNCRRFSVLQHGAGDQQAFEHNVIPHGRARGLFKRTVYIGFAEEKVLFQGVKAPILGQVSIDVGNDSAHNIIGHTRRLYT